MAGLGAGQHPWWLEGKVSGRFSTLQNEENIELKMMITEVMKVSFRVAKSNSFREALCVNSLESFKLFGFFQI